MFLGFCISVLHITLKYLREKLQKIILEQEYSLTEDMHLLLKGRRGGRRRKEGLFEERGECTRWFFSSVPLCK